MGSRDTKESKMPESPFKGQSLPNLKDSSLPRASRTMSLRSRSPSNKEGHIKPLNPFEGDGSLETLKKIRLGKVSLERKDEGGVMILVKQKLNAWLGTNEDFKRSTMLPLDGIFTAKMKLVVKAFQKEAFDKGIRKSEPNGIVDKETLLALEKSINQKPGKKQLSP
jgi:hypothetical protein